MVFCYSPKRCENLQGQARQVLCITIMSARAHRSQPKQHKRPAHQALFRRHLHRYLLEPVYVTLSESYVKQLATAAEPSRPIERRKVKNFGTASPLAELLPDLALWFGRETLLVEIKPKCGVLSRSALVHPDINDALQKFKIPPYYFTNYLFPSPGREVMDFPDQEHRYDPLKMLLGIDIELQLKILHEERSRSLRIFNCGARLSHEDATCTCNDGLCTIALDIAAKAVADESRDGEHCFRKLLAVQRHDYIDNIGAGLLLKHLISMIGMTRAYEMIEQYEFMRGAEKWTAEDENEFRASKQIISYETAEEADRLHSHEGYLHATEEVARMKPNVCAKMLAEFMQAAAAKDCSFMISMCREDKAEIRQGKAGRDDKAGGFVQHEGRKWLYCVHVIDTGPKPVDKLLLKWPAVDLELKKSVCAAGGLDKLISPSFKECQES